MPDNSANPSVEGRTVVDVELLLPNNKIIPFDEGQVVHVASTIRESIKVDVSNGYLNIKNLEGQLVDFDAARKLGAENLRAVRYRYSSGMDRLIDVFDADNEMHDQELEYLGVLINYHGARDQLVLTLDGLLETVPK